MTDSDRSDKIGNLDPFDGEVPDLKPDSISTKLVVDPDFDGEIEGAVPIGVLEDLADEWEQEAETTAMRNGGDRYAECASELRETIADYTDE